MVWRFVTRVTSETRNERKRIVRSVRNVRYGRENWRVKACPLDCAVLPLKYMIIGVFMYLVPNPDEAGWLSPFLQ